MHGRGDGPGGGSGGTLLIYEMTFSRAPHEAGSRDDDDGGKEKRERPAPAQKPNQENVGFFFFFFADSPRSVVNCRRIPIIIILSSSGVTRTAGTSLNPSPCVR